jgi:hypothetical protein
MCITSALGDKLYQFLKPDYPSEPKLYNEHKPQKPKDKDYRIQLFTDIYKPVAICSVKAYLCLLVHECHKWGLFHHHRHWQIHYHLLDLLKAHKLAVHAKSSQEDLHCKNKSEEEVLIMLLGRTDIESHKDMCVCVCVYTHTHIHIYWHIISPYFLIN